MHTNYGRGVKLMSDERQVWTLVLVQRLQERPSNLQSADLWDLQRLGYCPGQVGHMLACDFRSAAAHAVPLIFILAGFIRLNFVG